MDTLNEKAKVAARAVVDYDQTALDRRSDYISKFVRIDEISREAVAKTNMPGLLSKVVYTAQNILAEPQYQSLEAQHHQLNEDFGFITTALANKYKDAPDVDTAVPLNSPAMATRLSIDGRVIDVRPEEKQAYEALRQKTNDAADNYWAYIKARSLAFGVPESCVFTVGRALHQSHYEETMEEAAKAKEKRPFDPMIHDPHEKKGPRRT